MMQAEGGPIASFREIHKNAWLKRIPPNGNCKLLGQKKVTVERWWIVFCVHGDVEPYLEGYTDAGGAAAAHTPRWRAPLSRAIHVSGSVGPAKPNLEYEFVVALQDGAIRLIAPSWESMQDWVDTLRNKLREMKILSPKENVYSKAPEQTRPRAPTRDPTSPLPAPPPGPAMYVPGTEPSIRLPSASFDSGETFATDGRLPMIRTNNITQSESASRRTAESDEEPSFVTNENCVILENCNPSNDASVSIPDVGCNSTVDSNINCKKDRNISKHKGAAQKNNSSDSSNKSDNDKPSSDSVSFSLESIPSTSFDGNVSQKYTDDSVSKIEMDFSKLVFHNESHHDNKTNVDDDDGRENDFNISNSDFSTNQKTEFTSTVANVSGMNICLTDSVLEHRIKSESDNEFFTEFDLDENSILSPDDVFTGTKLDSDINYSKVDSKKCKSNANNEIKMIKSKPTVTPRTIIFKNYDIGILTDPAKIQLTNESIPDENQVATNRLCSLQNHIVERKKGVDVKYETNLNNVNCDKLHKDASNVTIIKVSNETIRNACPSIPTIINEKTIRIDNVPKNNSERSYVNVVLNSDDKVVNKVQIASDNKTVEKKNDDNESQELISVNVTKSLGYGHIRHTTTIGVKNNENSSIINEKCAKNQTITSSNTLSPVNNTFQTNICDNTNIFTLLPPSVSPKDNTQKVVNTSILEIDHEASNSRYFSFDQPPHVDSTNTVKLINLSSPPNTSKVFENSPHVTSQNISGKSDQFYESVFTPFTISQTAKTLSKNIDNNRPSSSQSIATDKMNKISKNCVNPHDYEFLAWKSNENACNDEIENLPTRSLNMSSEIQNQENVISICRESRDKKHTAVPEINLSEYRPQPLLNKCDEFLLDKNPTLSSSIKNTKHNLFTRGLTELNIVSKFRNMGQPNSSRMPLLKNSQFYSYVEVDPSSSSTSNDLKSNNENKKNNVLTTKLNNLFNKTTDPNVSLNKTPDVKQILRIESSLRRNWSEHNDRTMLPVVKTAAELKAHRSRVTNNPNIHNATSDERQVRRRSSSLSESHSTSDNSCSLVESPKITSNNNNANNGGGNPPLLSRPLGLREQQVARLRGEMAHAGGVRLRLRTRDCPGEAMALADGYGTVWICGWKQRTHPLLYNALHIGDRLASVGGVTITNVRQAKSALKDTSSGLLHIELVIKRLPHGRVYTLKKESDTQDLGLVMDSATIIGIVPGSPAAQAGVTPNGTLTEINGRPLNLLLKKGDTQVRDRLNAIGRDISILIQPTEFVAILRASLRNMRSHKDYIVQ